MKNLFFISFILIISLDSFSQNKKTFNVMSPLVVQDWDQFKMQLKQMKAIGVNAISTDVWWGLVEKQDNQFDFNYYDKVSDEIINAGLKWMPILSTHQCGGNVGDECNIPLPNWIWKKYIGKHPLVKNENALKYKSEQGNFSSEVISAWATKITLNEYADFYQAFADHYKNKIQYIAEINLSLGPAGELRFPSYNSHDQNAGYPTRGAIQAYSDLAVLSFQDAMKNKYKDIKQLNSSWNATLSDWNEVYPPTDYNHTKPDQFFQNQQHLSNYGKDFFSWYRESLIEHGKILMQIASQIFSNVHLGAKVPGVHWRMASDRLAEVAAGLLATDDSLAFQLTQDKLSPLRLGYEPIFKLFSENNFILHFTCLEMSNYENQSNLAYSLAETLVFLVSSESLRFGVNLKGENALSGNLGVDKSWENMNNVMKYSNYQGLTFLRMNLFDDYAMNQLRQMIQKY